jgi:hypothetical protein
VAGTAVDALLLEPHGYRTPRLTVTLPYLPAGWDGATIAVIADMHIGPYSTLDDARAIVHLCNNLQPDIIALVGDYVSEAAAISRALVEVLRDLRCNIGKFAVLGNHDYWSDPAAMRHTLQSADIDLLCNAHRTVSRNDTPLCIAGVDDLWSTRPGPDIQATLADVPTSTCRIVLCHNPDYVVQLPTQPRVDLMIAGHTHGGQVRLPLLGAPILPITHREYAEGLTTAPRCKVFTSRGLGMVSVPVRFNCPPELPLLTLRQG